MSMNIKNEEAHKLARELADLTGESITEAVTEALRERLARLHNAEGGTRLERMLQIAHECATHLKEPYRSIDHAEMLYDERGLPK
jgi:antitoxin VapB